MQTLSRSIILSAVSAALVATLTGCGISSLGSADKTGSSPLTHKIEGQVYGGQQPVGFASIKLYAATTNGYGQAATNILTSPITTDANGGFTLTNDYNCPTNADGSSALVYMTGTGGQPMPGTTNPALGLMAALGNCATLKANAATTFLTVNEVTTVAAAYALAGFMTSPTAVSSSGTAAGILGLQNAFANANLLASTTYGTPYALIPALTATAPSDKVYSLANALAACINSDGTGTPCTMLFGATTVGGVVPTNTLQAVLNIAHFPGQNVMTIYNVSAGVGAPFPQTLSTQPNDWTLPLTFTGGAISSPQGVAIDASGNAWVANKTNTLTQITPAGAFTFGPTGFTTTSFDAPSSIAIDTAGKVWVANCGTTCSSSGNAASVTQVVAVGAAATGNTVTGSGLNATYAVAVDGSNNVWAANTFGNSVTELASDRSVKSGTTGFATGGLAYPVALALDASGNAWLANPAANSITKLSSAGAALSGVAGFTTGGLSYPYGIAIDHSGNAWIANHTANTVVVLNATGVAQSGASGYTAGGINLPNAIALDGAGNAWVTNTNSSVSEVTAAGVGVSQTTGYTAALKHPNAIAVDGSGNVWITSCGAVCTGTSGDVSSVVELIGAGSPVATPIAQGAASNLLGSKP